MKRAKISPGELLSDIAKNDIGSFDAILNEKYGKIGTPEREEFHREAYAYLNSQINERKGFFGDLFTKFAGFLRGDDDSLRLDAVTRRHNLSDLRYETAAADRLNLREDMRRLRGDFRNAMNEYPGKVKKN